MQAVILAAGRGKRLHPITATRTKAMAPILGMPIVERVMEILVANGLRKFILVISPDDDEICEYFAQKSQISVDVKFVTQEQPLGMGHALLQAAPFIQGDFILSSCDNLIPAPDVRKLIQAWEQEPHPSGVLSLLPVGPEKIHRMGIVKLDGEWVIEIVEKPTLEEAPSNIGSTPLYLFTKKLIAYLQKIKPSKRGEYELQAAIQMLIADEGGVRGVQISGRIDLTTPADLLTINKHYFTPGYTICESSFQNVELISPYHIEAKVTIGENCRLGPNVYIEKGCTIRDNVLLENVVVLREREVPKDSEIRNQVVY